MEFGPRTTWDLKLALSVVGGLSILTGWTKYVDVGIVSWIKDGLVLSAFVLTFMVTGATRPPATPTDNPGRTPR